MWEKLGGVATIVVAIAVLSCVSIFDPPTYIQIICGLGGSVVCLFGVVFAFAEGSILEARRSRKAPKAN